MAPVRHSLVETRIKKNRIHRGEAVDFCADDVRLPNGRAARREYLDHPGAVGVIPFLDRDTIVMVRQYRYPVGRTTCEIPAGKLARGEDPLACVRRELREETGYKARGIRRLLKYWPTPAFANELLHLYVAEGLEAGPARPDDDEFLRPVLVDFNRAVGWALNGRLRDSKTVIALLACRVLRGR